MSTSPAPDLVHATAIDIPDLTHAFQPLKLSDRCDRCPSQALVRATFPLTGFSLYFCGHHGHRFADALEVGNVLIHREAVGVRSNNTDH